ncbi:TonB-dependent receptor [Pseudohalioglobus sediminis]|uniref:TonB-dependent receptor n=1 Tax=Pseudohalioglobus sediminis TaxID=2606449 RepID=A0A5B0X5C7_9GAMM|nr:TonB-dependent receptor [Pseudohalioglobus sediminis]KAA1193389.1 TonB-dependent receptor [Pseudohalioglobus sediminis]
MTPTKTPIALGLAAAVASFMPAPMTFAQEVALEEVVVTARKRTENLQDVPIAISAIDETTIQRAGIERAADYIGLVPNVTIVDAANVGDTQVSIRGVVSTRDAESTFAYVVDGVLSTNPNSFNEELFDVQQIEVLKGPQGALYGRNAVAGAVLVTTKAPTNEFEARIGGGIANNDAYKVNAMVSGPIIDDTLLGRFAISTRETDGFYKNIFTGEDDAVDYLEDTSARARVIWNVSDAMTLDFRGGYSEVKGGAINFNAAFAIPQFVEVFGAQSYFQDVNEMDFRYTFNTPGENEQETLDFSVKMDWDLGFADLVASVAYNDLEEYLLSDGTSATFYGYEVTPACQSDRETLNSFNREDLFGPLFDPFGVLPPGADTDFQGVYGPYTATSCDGYQYQERNQEDLSLDARLVSPGDEGMRWIAGIYVAEIEREVVVAYGADQGQGFRRQPYVAADGPNPTDLLFWDDFDTTVYAAYGQLEFDLTDTLELALAARYDYEDREVSNKVPNVNGSGLNINLPGKINPALESNPAGIPDRDDSFSHFQPKATLNWAASDNVNLYASYGVGFRSGGFNSVGTEDLLNFWFNAGFGGAGEAVDAQLLVTDEYDKEVSTAYEIGLKSELFDNRLRLNAAIFRTDVEDNQFFEFFAGPFGLLRSVTTIDEMYVQGFEADFTFLVTDGLSFYGGIGLLDSEIEENRNRPLSEGNDVPQAPDTTGNLGVEWVLPLGSFDLVSRLDWQYVGETWFHTLQGEETPTIWNAFFGPGFNQNFSRSSRDAYDTLDLRIGLESEHWMITAWGRNLTDEDYLQEVIPAPEFGGSFNHQSAQRSYGLDFSYRF